MYIFCVCMLGLHCHLYGFKSFILHTAAHRNMRGKRVKKVILSGVNSYSCKSQCFEIHIRWGGLCVGLYVCVLCLEWWSKERFVNDRIMLLLPICPLPGDVTDLKKKKIRSHSVAVRSAGKTQLTYMTKICMCYILQDQSYTTDEWEGTLTV